MDGIAQILVCDEIDMPVAPPSETASPIVIIAVAVAAVLLFFIRGGRRG